MADKATVEKSGKSGSERTVRKLFEVVKFEHDESGKTTRVLGIPYPMESENPVESVITLGDSSNGKRPTLDRIEKGKGDIPPVQPGGVIQVRFSPENQKGQSIVANWVDPLSYSPDATREQLETVSGNVFRYGEKEKGEHYAVSIPRPDLSSKEKGEGRWLSGIVRATNDKGEVLDFFQSGVSPKEKDLTLEEKFQEDEYWNTFLERARMSGARLETVVFENISLTAVENMDERDRKFLDSLAFRTIGQGENARIIPDDRLRPMVLKLSPSRPDIINDVVPIGRPTVSRILAPSSENGKTLSWASKEERAAFRAQTVPETKAEQSQGIEPEKPVESPVTHEEAENPDLSLPGLEPVGTKATPATDLYSDDDLSMN
ncbi:hypothetical protein [Leptospirillum ferriphilum]|uniref:hypothetical protein n=1 Tax=Leptospirillum ferriphilum TaxID=178606 RepID=UPI0006B15BD4|nr:hypothetical protein [Leptospirillum ferriphilum]